MDILPDDIVLEITAYLPFKDIVKLSTVDRATRALLHSADFISKRATIVAPEPQGLLRTMETRFPIAVEATHVPYNDARGRLHQIRLDFLVPCNSDDHVTVETSHGGYILYSTTPPRPNRFTLQEIDICICNPVTLYRTVLPRLSSSIPHFNAPNLSSLMFVNGVAPNIRYRIAFVYYLWVIAYDSGNNRGWQLLLSLPGPHNYHNQSAILGQLAAANFESLFVYKYRYDDSSIRVFNLEAQSVRFVKCPPGFDCCDVFIDHRNNRIIALGMVPDVQGGGGSRFSFRELQLQRPPNLGWTEATLAQESVRLNDQLASEPAYSDDWTIFRAPSLNSLLFRRGNDFAIYNVAERSWSPFQVADGLGQFLRPEMYSGFQPLNYL